MKYLWEYLNEVLAHFCSVEHGVESCNFVNFDGVNSCDFRDFIHRSQWKPTTALSLCQIKKWNYSSLLIISRISR